ncbi:Diphthamide biosynthesis protein 4 [Microsporum canis]|uniref:Diphthamide biosynthesis protein 4 n=1 Tax=Arthroderma otae (strain ATCC MYA-4605 / CBS 113480) TaxID=554155 RepID=C5FSA5_ARTOC|nr:diphthamide biosynthesis protein 4 [Microsporum canis CBS 113480]EEQ32758.1 diphthamide biosynthesis protein 4 [Microsporum canis CBS 113480]
MAPSDAGHEAISHYEILHLPHPPVSLRNQDIKAAYHRALLQYHPDKSGSSTPSSPGEKAGKREIFPRGLNTPKYVAPRTVDQITAAYKVLSNPAAKAEYDQALLLSGFGKTSTATNRNENDDLVFRTGLEVLDLDDMVMETVVSQPGGDEEQNSIETWYRGCRCGDEKGFMVSETDLENEAEKGEIIIGCRGCSLWAKVVFAVHEDTDG